MTARELHKRYFDWLFQQIWPSEPLIEGVYRSDFRDKFDWLYNMSNESLTDEMISTLTCICDEMDRIPFRWDPRIVLDEDRAAHGYNLRETYLVNRGLPLMLKSKYMDQTPVSTFEVLVAMSIRCDEIEGDPDYPGETAPLWFWSMIKNMHILFGDVNYRSDREVIRRSVDYRIDQFLDRKYSYYGDGGPFRVDHPRKDLRKTDLWMQMNWWLEEQFGSNFVINW